MMSVGFDLLRKNMLLIVLFLVLGLMVSALYIHSQRFRSPDILVIGDSQISFGSGRAFMEFFENFEALCKPSAQQKIQLARLGKRSFGAIGVRSTSLHTWVARDDKRKAMICDVDKKWGVNAGIYGVNGNPNRRYVQIGQGEEYQFCKPDRSAFEAMFHNRYYDPKLVVMAFLGNAAERWANDESAALRDVTQTLEQLPDNVPCVFMTTTPSYLKGVNDLRQVAQANVKTAFERKGSRCGFVEGFTPQTRASSLGNKAFFTQNKAGEVIDPHHPNIDAARHFMALKAPELCQAVLTQLDN